MSAPTTGSLRIERPIPDLVAGAIGGDETAWRHLVDRLSPIIWAACRRYRLSDHDAADVAQTVFFRLVENLPRLRQPAALPGWVKTTAQRECLKLHGERERQRPASGDLVFDTATDPEAEEPGEALLEEEYLGALREAFATLPDHCQQLLRLLMADRPLPYKAISERIGRSVGGIGPTRARCLDHLRSAPALRPWAPPTTTPESRP